MRVAVGSDHAGFDLKEILRADLGVCVCGSGNGIAMAANKIPGVRAAVVHDVTTASLAGKHNHANVVCFGARTTGAVVVIDALSAFLVARDAFRDAPEDSARHQVRIEKLAALDEHGHDRELAHLTAPEGTP